MQHAIYLILPILFLCFPTSVSAADSLDTGDTAWMLTATALVLFMTIPGLALFYGGLVRAKNVLSVLMQCFVLTALMTIIWVALGYSLAFDTTGMVPGAFNFNSFVGGLGKAFLSGITAKSLTEAFPESIFVCFQMTFAIITPALIVGAFAERIKFSALLLFMSFWSILVYAPVCHMAWSGPGSFFGNLASWTSRVEQSSTSTRESPRFSPPSSSANARATHESQCRHTA